MGSLVSALHDVRGMRLRVYRTAPVPVLGPHLLLALRARLDGNRVFHGPANVLPMLGSGIPSVLSIQDLAIYDHPEWFPSGQWLSTRVLVPASIRRARLVLCPSQATSNALQRLFSVPPDRIRVIAHGVGAEFGQPAAPAHRNQVRARLGLPERYLLQVGTVQPRKNVVASLRALALIPEPQRIPLIVAGQFGWSYGPVLQAVQALGLAAWVRFVGYVEADALPALYQMAQALLFPSYDEGFGLPVLEAFAAGTPVIAASTGSILEVAGEAAILCHPDDAQAMADAFMRLTRDPDLRSSKVAAGRARSARYSWAASAAAHRAAYAEVAR